MRSCNEIPVPYLVHGFQVINVKTVHQEDFKFNIYTLKFFPYCPVSIINLFIRIKKWDRFATFGMQVRQLVHPEVLAMLSLQRTSLAHFEIGPPDIAGYGRYRQITSNNLIVLGTPGYTILSYLWDIRKLKRSVKGLLQGADRKVKGSECNRLGN